MKNFVLASFYVLVFCVVQKSSAQSDWDIELGFSVVRFSDKYVTALNDKHSLQVPRFSVTGKLNNRFSINGAISFNSVQIKEIAVNNSNYFSVDTFLRYALFNRSKYFEPYIFAGASLVSVEINFTPIANIGGGATIWVSNNFGLNGQVMYKHSNQNISHSQFTGGIIYRLNDNNSRSRLWNKRH